MNRTRVDNRRYSGGGRDVRQVYSTFPEQTRRNGQETIDWIGDIIKIVLIVVVVMFCISMSSRAYEIGYSIFYEKAVDTSGSGQKIEVTVTSDMSVKQIGDMLQASGLISEDGEIFQYQERFSSYHGKIQPGTYTLSTEMKPSEIIKAMAEGQDTDAAN